MSNFLNSIAKVSAYKETENGAFALSTTGKELLNCFGLIGSLRLRSTDDINMIFMKAYAEDKSLAMKMLFYTRDCRGGLGERRTFRTIAKYLADNYPEDIKLNLELIPEYGRFDDLYAFVGTKLEADAFKVLEEQFEKDLTALNEGKPISNLGKWLKSCNTSSLESNKLGKLTAKYFGLSEKDYRKALSKLRSYSNVVEVKMSSNNWEDIEYSTVPSYASRNYAAAFQRHDEERYEQYIHDVNSGKQKINSSTLFPYDLIKQYDIYSNSSNPTIEAQWKALPNYVSGEKKFLIMSDVSGSMTGQPMNTSVGLGIYFAERNTGAYHGKVVTFTDTPKFIDLDDNLSLREKINILTSNVGYNTDLEKAFELILNSAISGKVSQEDLPDALVVISDMEIDEFGSYSENTTFTSEMKKRFKEAGYEMPTLVYWNVNARMNTFHSDADENVRFVSGSSAAVFAGLCDHMGLSASELMHEVLESERYKPVRVSK